MEYVVHLLGAIYTRSITFQAFFCVSHKQTPCTHAVRNVSPIGSPNENLSCLHVIIDSYIYIYSSVFSGGERPWAPLGTSNTVKNGISNLDIFCSKVPSKCRKFQRPKFQNLFGGTCTQTGYTTDIYIYLDIKSNVFIWLYLLFTFSKCLY